MESIKQRQVAELIKRHFSMILQSEGSYIYGPEPLVTVTQVKMTPDFGLAKVYLSIYNTENKQAVILQMEDSYTRLRQSLAARLRKQVRRIPDLKFFLDDTLDELYRIDALMNRVRQGDAEIHGEEE